MAEKVDVGTASHRGICERVSGIEQMKRKEVEMEGREKQTGISHYLRISAHPVPNRQPPPLRC
jgi:hypothetical protein